MNAIEASRLGKRYRRNWALRQAGLAIPAGRVAALVGPNGAGKTTLLDLAVGLTAPTAGSVTVLGGLPAGSVAALQRVAFVAQDAPLYKNLSVADTLHLARNLNLRWDQRRAEERLAELGIPGDRKVGKLSKGHQVQLALTVAIARHPDLLVLDEPLASLDPLARHDFMASLMSTVAEDGMSVVFSSHVVSELERVADYLVVLSSGRIQVSGDVEDLLGSHRMLTGPAADADDLALRFYLVHARRRTAQAHLLVRIPPELGEATPVGWESHPVT
jgi:ABC-2 type transport system ATP-binding protein